MQININIVSEWCDKQKPSNCPVKKYLDRQRVLSAFSGTTNEIGSELDIEKNYRINLDSKNVSEKFINIYKKALEICELCQKEEKIK